MIYELALSVKAGIGDEQLTKSQEMILSVIQSHEGELLATDDWGRLALPQTTRKGIDTVRMLYFIYSGNNEANKELTRRLKLMEERIRHLIVLVGDDSVANTFTENLKIPFSKKYPGSVVDDDDDDDGYMGDGGHDKKKFIRKRGCYFTIKGIKADWKDPKTYSPLVNEFGKITLARISNVSRKHQRFVTTAIKRARNIGLIGHLSNRTAYPI